MSVLFSGERDAFFVPDNPNIALSIPPTDPVITVWDINFQDRLQRIKFDGIFPSAFYYISKQHIAIWEYGSRKILLIDYLEKKVAGVINGKIGDIPPTGRHSNTWQHLGGFEFLATSEDSKDLNRWDIRSGKLLCSIKTNDKFGIANFMVRS